MHLCLCHGENDDTTYSLVGESLREGTVNACAHLPFQSLLAFQMNVSFVTAHIFNMRKDYHNEKKKVPVLKFTCICTCLGTQENMFGLRALPDNRTVCM